MIEATEKLTAEEMDLMLKAPVLVTILIAGADNEISKDEKEWAVKLARYRKFTSNPRLNEYYFEVDKFFAQNLEQLIAQFPSEAAERNPLISRELEKLNPVLLKLKSEFANSFYQSLLSFARKIAESSGGILGIGSVSKEEKQWLKLEMINPPEKTDGTQ